MKVFSVIGKSGSGKTTIIERLIGELKKRHHTVGTLKEIHFEGFAIDQEGTNTDRHHRAGADLVTARGYDETDLLFKERLPLEKILEFYTHDYVILEGAVEDYIPKIVAARSAEEIDELLDGTVLAISGRIAEELEEYRGLPVINVLDGWVELTDLVEEKVFEKLPGFPGDCCELCGHGCAGFAEALIRGRALREECVLGSEGVRLFVGGREIEMVDFVRRVLRNTVTGIVGELRGYSTGAEIEIRIGERDAT